MQKKSLAAMIFISNVEYTFLMLMEKNVHFNTSSLTAYIYDLSLINTIIESEFQFNLNIKNKIATVGHKMPINLRMI
jgi:hypothetical protein